VAAVNSSTTDFSSFRLALGHGLAAAAASRDFRVDPTTAMPKRVVANQRFQKGDFPLWKPGRGSPQTWRAGPNFPRR